MSPDEVRPRRVLVFTRATGYVHGSIPDAVAAIRELGGRHGFVVVATDDPDRFAPSELNRYGAVALVHTSGDVLPRRDQRRALERYLELGGGVFAVHGAACIDPEVQASWPWYRSLLGAAFTGHTAGRIYCDAPVPESGGMRRAGPLSEAPDHAERIGDTVAVTSCEPAVIRIEDPRCPAADGFRDGETRIDEWYGFDENPRGRVHVVATVDESTYEPAAGAMGPDHPIVWWQPVGAGRSVYNAMGHASSTWADPSFLRSVLGGLSFAARWDEQ